MQRWVTPNWREGERRREGGRERGRDAGDWEREGGREGDVETTRAPTGLNLGKRKKVGIDGAKKKG